MKKELDNYLHINSETAEIMLHKIQESEKERKAIAGVTKQARERAKKVSLHNKKLRDCRIHPLYSSQRATPPPAQSQKYATWRLKPCSPCGASR